MSLEELIAEAVERKLGPRLARLEQALGGGTVRDELASIPKAAKACGISAETVRRHYLPRLRKYGSGRTLRISVAELRSVMTNEREQSPDIDAMADRLVGRSGRHG